MKKLIEEIQKEIESIEIGYEMGCLISSEFTPAPSFESIFDIVRKHNKTPEEVLNFLGTQSKKEFEELKDDSYQLHNPENGEFSPTGKTIYFKDLDESYTPSGCLYNELQNIFYH